MRPVFLLIALAACGSATGPTMSTLKNDAFVSGVATFVSAFASGEGAAAKLGPQSNDFTVRSVQFLFGGSDTAKTVTLTIYDDVGNDAPGAVLYSHDYPLTPSNAGFQQIDLTAQHIAVASGHSIRVAVFFQHDGLPSVAKDGDGINSSRNYIFSTGGWVKAESVGINGDFIIRAEIES